MGSTLGKRIRQRREEMGADLSTVARWAGVPVDRLTQVEDGVDDLESSEFESICRALAIDPSAMFSGSETESTRTTARFRTAWGVDSPVEPSDLRLLSSAAEAGRVIGNLLHILQREPRLKEYRRTVAVTAKPEPFAQGYQLGKAARQKLSNSSSPIESVEQLLHSHDVHIVRIRFSSSRIEAVSIWEPEALPIILLNSTAKRVDYSLARRAVLAHELCHLLHDAGEGDITTLTTWKEGNSSYHSTTEQRARGFAPSFIAPCRHIKKWSSTLKRRQRVDPRTLAISAANHWGLSYEGSVWHIKNCDLILEHDCDDIQSKRPAQNELYVDSFESLQPPVPPEMLHHSLPKHANPMMAGVATQIVVDALNRETISLGRAREILAWY